MSWVADLSTSTMVACGDHIRAIGWLSADHHFPQGAVAVTFQSRLSEFVRLAAKSAEALSFPSFGGFHTCELCQGFHESRNFGVPSGELLYVAPGMVAHYVGQHGYCPPVEFVAAVLTSPLPDTPEYEIAVAEFRRCNQEWWEAYFKRLQARTS